MLPRLWSRFTYWMERSFVRGAQYRLLLIAAALGLISMAGGVLVVVLGSGFDDLGDATWWAFLRLSDPGYLGDDEGTVNRTVSTILTVLGYVVFLGALVAVMTQWLNARMERLEMGLTPVARDGHILVLGWTNRTDSIVRELLMSKDRVRRFLRRHGTGGLHIVVMAEKVDASLAQDLRDAVGEVWDENDVTLRSGNPLRMEHLTRVDHLNAAVIIVPGAEFDGGGTARTDAHMLKTLLSLKSDPDPTSTRQAAELPLVVAEIFDTRKIEIARGAYPGSLQIVSSDAVVGRLLAQNVRHPRLSHVYHELLTHEGGSEIYIREHPELDGKPFSSLAAAFPRSIVLGVIRGDPDRYVAHLNPGGDFYVEASDRFVHLAQKYSDTARTGPVEGEPAERGEPTAAELPNVDRSVLILGWNHKVPALIREFATYPGERFRVRILSTVAATRRKKAIGRYDIPAAMSEIEHIEGDYTDIADLRRASPSDHDTVLVVGSDRTGSEEEADARTIVGSLLLEQLDVPHPSMQTIVELLDPDNVRLIGTARGEVIISSMIVSHMLVHVALRPELGAVFGELFTAGGSEITFQPVDAYRQETSPGEITFGEVRRVAFARGEIALGFQLGPRARDLRLNPASDTAAGTDGSHRVVTLQSV